MKGVDLATFKELLGDADIKMTLRYAHLASAHKKKTVDILGRSGQQRRSSLNSCEIHHSPKKKGYPLRITP